MISKGFESKLFTYCSNLSSFSTPMSTKITDDESILKKQWNQSIFFTIVFISFYLLNFVYLNPLYFLFYFTNSFV